jgi:hypothetical protein
MDWKSLSHVRELGRQAAREALAAEPDLARRWIAGRPVSGLPVQTN